MPDKLDCRLVVLAAVCLAWCPLVAATAAGQDAQGPGFFLQQVAPILQRRCLPCHDQEHRKGDFSLQTEADLADTGYVQPGDSRGSYLLEMVTPTAERAPAMPKDSDPLTAEQVDILRRWIEAGADWPDQHQLEPFQVQSRDWWSWKPLQAVPVPPVPDAYRDWARTPIDAFVLQQLLSNNNNLRPSAEADRATLIRRLYFDLTGLPPTPDEIQSFVRDPDPQAYQRLLNRLLDSPRYGEHWARHWLDIVHYGDSHGYDKDKPRPNAWPYRDYVIRSFNQDKPYHRFVQEQIAGDVLWPETMDGLVATGFIAAGPWDFIGHAEVLETKLDGKVARNLDRDDMVTNTLNTFCSLTIQCARCHNHKLDAVTMQDYYRLQAVFAAIDRADRPFDADPAIAQRRSALQQQHDDLQHELADLQQQLEELKSPELKTLEAEIAELQAQISQSTVSDMDRSPAYGYHSQVADKPDTVKWVQVDLGAAQPIDTLILFGANEYGWADFGFPVRFRIEVGEGVELDHPTIVVDHTQQAFDRPGSKPVVFTFPVVSARYVRITATGLWSRRRLGQPETDDWIFALGELAVIGQGRLHPIAEVTALDTIEALPRWGRRNLADGVYGRAAAKVSQDETAPDDPSRRAALLLEMAEPDTLRKDLDRLVIQAEAMLKQQAGPERLERQAQLVDSLAAVSRQQQALPAPSLVYAGIVYEGSGTFRGRKGLGPRDIHILERGDVSQPGPRVRPGTVPLMDGVPAVFELADEQDEAQRRAALARWITQTDHPLTWRSIVNRVWLYHFGRGIVDSPNDFGRGGKLPTHPELLDWLAADFRDGNQSLKQLHRLICSSAVYRQQSLSDPDRAAVDGDNRLLWRMNRRRLTAEEIRDSVLKAAGLLDTTMGGPGFMDFVIEHPEHSPHYQYHLHDPNDPQTHRRAVYRFLVRSQPQPLMNVLDCADPSVSVPKRDETLTALQALSLLNNDFMIVMSERFAERLQRDHAQLPDQVRGGFGIVTGREPSADELQALVHYAQQFGLPNTCRWMFNLNEFVFLD